MSDAARIALAVLEALLRAVPDLAKLISGALDGDEKCVDEVRRILPSMEGESAEQLRRFRGILS